MKKLIVLFAVTFCLFTFNACETENINEQDQEYEQNIKSIDKDDDEIEDESY